MSDAYRDGMTWREREIAQDAARLIRLRMGRELGAPLYESRAAMAQALQSAFESAGHSTALAEYDLAGDCTLCGESGRCPGVHIVASQRPTKRDQVQQSLAFDLPLFARAS